MTDKRKFPSGGKENGIDNLSYSAHISNGKSAINSKSKLSDKVVMAEMFFALCGNISVSMIECLQKFVE